MLTLTAPSAASKYSASFVTTRSGKVWAHIYSVYNSGTITMEVWEPSLGTPAWEIFYPDGTAATFTSTSATGVSITKCFDLPGGLEFHFLNDATADSTVCKVDGDAIRVNVTDGN